ncbi:MAG TPA: hemolysin III family protein [Brumimicrobium sp.]|nr:hemolysin III family protein [Brumimicrobium sp.]
MSDYSPVEERFNVVSHFIGFLLSTIALLLLLVKTISYGTPLAILSVLIYGVSLIVLYAASTLYHNAKAPKLRKRLKIFDHAAIFLLIAGTYAPYTLITLNGHGGWIIFGVVWSIALVGVILKLFFTGKYKIVSTIMYVLMAWVIVFAVKPLMDNLSSEGLFWLAAGGLFYMIGALLYSIQKIKFNHAIFHVFVLLGSFSHFYSIYFYVLQGK